jgi:hypothetical protein
MSPPSPLTDPDVQISRFRFFMEELRSRMASIRDSLVEKGAEWQATPVRSWPV